MDSREYAHIVEFSYNPREEQFVIRFLDNSSYVLKIVDLPKKFQTKKPKWRESKLSSDHSGIIIQAGGDLRMIPFNIIHSRGVQV